MNELEQIADDLYNCLYEIEALVDKYLLILQQENGKVQGNENLTLRDVMFSQRKIEQIEKNLRNKAQDFVLLGEKNKNEFENIIISNDGLSADSLEFVFREIALRNDIWIDYIEKYMIEIIDKYRIVGNKYRIDHFYALFIDLPDKLFDEKSGIIEKLVYVLTNVEDVKLIYAITHFLWIQNYSYSNVINAFKKNINNPDWRIRLVSYDSLRTWKREYNMNELHLPTLSILDKVKRRIFKNVEDKLID